MHVLYAKPRTVLKCAWLIFIFLAITVHMCTSNRRVKKRTHIIRMAMVSFKIVLLLTQRSTTDTLLMHSWPYTHAITLQCYTYTVRAVYILTWSSDAGRAPLSCVGSYIPVNSQLFLLLYLHAWFVSVPCLCFISYILSICVDVMLRIGSVHLLPTRGNVVLTLVNVLSWQTVGEFVCSYLDVCVTVMVGSCPTLYGYNFP